MGKRSKSREPSPSGEVDLRDEDVYEAMKQIPGYLDITLGDFQEVYRLAYRHALERLSQQVNAADIMTREVITVNPDTPLDEVAEVMGSHSISGVPVVEENRQVVGIISENDYLSRMGVKEPKNFMSLVASCLRTKGCVALPIKKQRAADLMTAPAVTVSPHTPVKEIADLFTIRKINRVPVTDAEGRLVGIVTRGDIVRATRCEVGP